MSGALYLGGMMTINQRFHCFVNCSRFPTLLEVGLVLKKIASHLKCSYFDFNRISSLPEPLFPAAFLTYLGKVLLMSPYFC